MPLRRRVLPGRLRRRLTVAFLLVAAISAGALALGSFELVRQARLSDSRDRAEAEARFDLVVAGQFTFPLDEQETQGLLVGQESKGVHAILIVGGRAIASNPSFDLAIPGALRRLVENGQLGFERVEDGGRHMLLVGGRIPGSSDDLYFVFSEDRIEHDLVQLRNVLLGGWAVVVLLAGVVGGLLARRTLEPVARASQAARSITEGLLATRLPVEGQDEFGGWAASFNEMAEALETKITALREAQARERRFTSDVSHELRTPLTALVGEASLLAEQLDRLPEEAKRPAELLVQDVGRLRRLVEELMEVSRFDAGREAVRPETVDVSAVAAAAIRSRGWEGGVSMAGEPTTVRTDRGRLERIVANLVGNAIEHGGRDVQVTVGREGSSVFVEVTDRGRGIAPEHLGHLFDRFYKADRARAGGGSGLGLAIVKENATLLGGEVDVWSELGVGSRFTLRIPVTEPLPSGESGVPGEDEHPMRIPLEGGSP